MKTNKRRKQCRKHKAKGRSWDEYILSYTQDGIDYYKCLQCHKDAEIWLKNYEIQKQKEHQEWLERSRLFDERIAKQLADRKLKKETELWDCVVKRELLKGDKRKTPKLNNIPKELLQLKRATMKLQRAIKFKKEDLSNKLKQQEIKDRQDKEREAKILNCRIHGKLRWDQVVKSGIRNEEQQYRCVFCNRAMGNKSWRKSRNANHKKHDAT